MIGVISDVGKKRMINEDCADYLISPNYELYIVADGMGGHNAGEVASKIAVDVIKEYIKENWNNYSDGILLKDAILKANKKVLEYSSNSVELNGMGTTVTACLVLGGYTYIANVGDSACFILEDEKLVKITKDHSLVQELLDSGSITEEEAMNHPRKNVITRAVGAYEVLEVDIFKLPDRKGIKFLICSDGLLNEVSKEEITNVLISYNNEEAAKQLVILANEREGRDNITVLVFGGEN
ncbi:Stp1/IreP family PP2C-type Ser/Thr phosphatase [Clostridium sp. 'White wine YQ']|uniref:Stp1/IreP family PP2C-type Ser/Thr phosphatase n=1 Tax=Clostridium sp. 'White wine YQ' TaxID=3027474 RepID=UPI002365BD26|nr:Stp1/IreP family PP2C-type Ser/Thr phosphatase [Clostridium sp. 'White wine YQ']MDD7793744.1 Stp1/IreP family PP2C-type Ser/Thr phosphatase [Clostridium sp. 'White wine YQ']